MVKTLEPITANIGGVIITVSAHTRNVLRKRVRQAAVVIGYVAGICAAAMAALAVLQSTLVLPVLACAAVAGVVVWRCRG